MTIVELPLTGRAARRIARPQALATRAALAIVVAAAVASAVALGMLTDVPAGAYGPQDPVRLAVGIRHLF